MLSTNTDAQKGDIPSDLSLQTVHDLRIVFACYQNTDRGTITIHQLADIVELLGDPRPSVSDLRHILSETDDELSEQSEESITFKMFVRFIVVRLQRINVHVRSKEIFRALDCDNSGEVSAAELKESLMSMGLSLNNEEVLAMTSVADTSKEGEINYSQFKQVCRRVDKGHDHKVATVETKIVKNKSMIRRMFSAKPFW